MESAFPLIYWDFILSHSNSVQMLVLFSYIQALMQLCLGLLVQPHVIWDAVVVLLPLAHKLLLQVGPLQVLLKVIATTGKDVKQCSCE